MKESGEEKWSDDCALRWDTGDWLGIFQSEVGKKRKSWWRRLYRIFISNIKWYGMWDGERWKSGDDGCVKQVSELYTL